MAIGSTRVDMNTAIAVYDALLDELIVRGYDKSEALVGALLLAVTQSTGKAWPIETLAEFVKDATQWIALYFSEGMGEGKKVN